MKRRRDMVNWDMAKWRKMREWLDGEIAYTGMVARESEGLNAEREMYLEGYRNALNYVRFEFKKINEEYEGYKIESAKRGGQMEIGKEGIGPLENVEIDIEEMAKRVKEKGQAQIVYEYWKNMGEESRKMKMNKESTITVKIKLSEEDIKECFIKAMEEMIEELKQK